MANHGGNAKGRLLLLPIACVFTATLLVSNTLDTKIFRVFEFDFPAGIILFPLAYLAGDILTEVYGYSAARKVIWSGFAGLLLMISMYEIARALPPAPFWQNQGSFDAVFSQVPRIVIASILAYLCGEFTNSFIVAKMKVWSSGQWMALRFVVSTIFGQLVDTAVFIVVAFSGVYAIRYLLGIGVSAWLAKVGWEVVALPITLVVVKVIKAAEREDYYDRDTDFSPFHL